MLSLLALVNARDQNQQVNSSSDRGVRETLIDVPADELKQMILSLLQDDGGAAADDQMPLDTVAEEEASTEKK